MTLLSIKKKIRGRAKIELWYCGSLLAAGCSAIARSICITGSCHSGISCIAGLLHSSSGIKRSRATYVCLLFPRYWFATLLPALKPELVDEIIQKPVSNDKLIALIERSFFLHKNKDHWL
jgi:hypothetical protein